MFVNRIFDRFYLEFDFWQTLRCILPKLVWNTCGYPYVKLYLIRWSFTHGIAKSLGGSLFSGHSVHTIQRTKAGSFCLIWQEASVACRAFYLAKRAKQHMAKTINFAFAFTTGDWRRRAVRRLTPEFYSAPKIPTTRRAVLHYDGRPGSNYTETRQR